MTGKVDIKGLDEINKKLRLLDKKMKASIARRALNKGGRHIRDEAKSRVPVRTGNLRDSITLRTKKLGRTGFLAEVGPAKRKGRDAITGKRKVLADGFYGRFVERGTKNMAPQPFMRPTYAAVKGRVPDVIGDEMWRLVKREVIR